MYGNRSSLQAKIFYIQTYILMWQIRVSPQDGDRRVKNPDNTRASWIFETKAQAESAARQIARNQNLELIIQRKDWTIQSRDSHWNDPYPPKG
jgi:hypothetical protein